MPRYVDGYVLPVPRAKLDAYKELAETAGAVWRDHGALEYVEAVADDLQAMEGSVVSFGDAVKLKDDEVVVFAFIVYPSREERDAINEKVMADPRMDSPPEDMPFDPKRMLFGGFTGLVDKPGAPAPV